MKKVFALFLVLVFAVAMAVVSGCRPAPTDAEPTAVPTPVPTFVFEDFPLPEPGANYNGGYWFAYTINPPRIYGFGGAPGYDATGYSSRVTMTGVAANDIWWVSALNSAGNADDLLSGYTGIKFYCKEVNGRPMKISIISALVTTPGNDFSFQFTPSSAWSQITVPFSSFTQPFGADKNITDILAAAERLAWVNAAASPSDYDFYLDQITLY